MAEERLPMRALVVDDSPAALQMMCSYLTRQGCVKVAGTAAEGSEALAMVEEIHPDIVVMDIQMPGMSGLEAVSRLSQRHPELPVILVTAHESPELQKASLLCGAIGFARKQRLREDMPGLLQQVRAA
jgi:CheY-like chemotaxis protein